MSDHRLPPDPLDRAYAQAETMLEDEGSRAARRARLLAAVHGEGRTETVRAPTASRRRPLPWRHGGWLAAASVAALGVLVAVREPRSYVSSEATAEFAPPSAATASPRMGGPASPATSADDAVAPEGPPPSGETAEVEAAAPLPPPPPLRPPPPSAPAPAAPRDTAEAAAPGGEIDSTAASARSAAAASPPVAEARLRAAATAGRVSELTALLEEGVLVDAADEVGDTALIKAVRANRPAAAALLQRYGADLDLENRQGESARDIAASIGDPELTRALSLAP